MDLYSSRIIRQQLTVHELAALKADFTTYKTTGRLPNRFGRDAFYDHPNTPGIIRREEVKHLHLADSGEAWHARQIQYYRTSDIHLVYCQGMLDENCYLLMSILKPDAHRKARDNTVMTKLGMMAEAFRLRF